MNNSMDEYAKIYILIIIISKAKLLKAWGIIRRQTKHQRKERKCDVTEKGRGHRKEGKSVRKDLKRVRGKEEERKRAKARLFRDTCKGGFSSFWKPLVRCLWIEVVGGKWLFNAPLCKDSEAEGLGGGGGGDREGGRDDGGEIKGGTSRRRTYDIYAHARTQTAGLRHCTLQCTTQDFNKRNTILLLIFCMFMGWKLLSLVDGDVHVFYHV